MNHALADFLAKADVLTTEAEARIVKASTIRRLIAELVEAANDNDDVPPPVAPIVAPISEVEVPAVVAIVEASAAPARVLKGKADEAILGTLTASYQCARLIHDGVIAAGVKLTRGAIYQRMPILVALYPNLIEQNGEAKEWRAKPPIAAPIVEPVAKSAASAKRKGKALPIQMSRRTTKATNDNAAVVANDILEPLALNTLHHGDCLKLMKAIPDRSVNLILCDLPYGTCGARVNGNDIDIRIDLDALWKEYRRIITPTGNIVLFGSQPFTTDLINSGRDWFQYCNVWRKSYGTGHPHARNKPLKDYEDIIVFAPGKVGHGPKNGVKPTNASSVRATFNPWKAREVLKRNNPKRNKNAKYAANIKAYEGRHLYMGLENCPAMVMEYEKKRSRGNLHPYAKPVELLDDLIRMYSNAGEVVLDNCAGSGATAVAAIGADRQWIAIEKDETCYLDAKGRIAAVGDTSPAANDNAKPTKPRRKVRPALPSKPAVKPSRPVKPTPDDEPPLPMIIPSFSAKAVNDPATPDWTSLPAADVVLADPPWSYYGSQTKDGAAANHYPTMTDAEILALPVRSIMAKRSVLFMWVTSPRLNFAMDCLKAWGLHYRGMSFNWVKTKHDGVTPIGAQGPRPSIVKPTSEFVLAASLTEKGRPLKLCDETIRQTILAPRMEHSRKPDAVHQAIEAMYPDARKVELFARRPRDGWTVWGNEVETAA